MAGLTEKGYARTQGTHLYAVDSTGSSPVLFKLGSLTGISGLNGGTTDEIDTTPLDAEDAKEFELGLSDPGEMSVTYIFKPADSNQRRLIDMYKSKLASQFIICLSDGSAVPTLDSNDEIEAPAGRTSYIVQALVKQQPVDISSNEVIRCTLPLRRTGTCTVTYSDGESQTY